MSLVSETLIWLAVVAAGAFIFGTVCLRMNDTAQRLLEIKRRQRKTTTPPR